MPSAADGIFLSAARLAARKQGGKDGGVSLRGRTVLFSDFGRCAVEILFECLSKAGRVFVTATVGDFADALPTRSQGVQRVLHMFVAQSVAYGQTHAFAQTPLQAAFADVQGGGQFGNLMGALGKRPIQLAAEWFGRLGRRVLGI